MVRAYEVDVVVDEKWIGFHLTCWDNDECVFEEFFKNSSDAHACGNAYLDGAFVSLMYADGV